MCVTHVTFTAGVSECRRSGRLECPGFDGGDQGEAGRAGTDRRAAVACFGGVLCGLWDFAYLRSVFDPHGRAAGGFGVRGSEPGGGADEMVVSEGVDGGYAFRAVSFDRRRL